MQSGDAAPPIRRAAVGTSERVSELDDRSTILIGVAVYLVLMIAIGIWASRRAGDTTDFILAGRGMPLWILGATVMATWFGGGAMMGNAGEAYEGGLLAVIADPFGGALALFLVGFFFVRLFRRLELLTVVQFFEQRYGPFAGVVASIAMIISNVGWVGGMLVAFGLVFETLTSVPMQWGIWGGAGIVLLYTALGGMWAVAVTDFVQMLIIILGLSILFIVVVVDVGGWGVIAAQLPEGTFRMIPREHTAESWTGYLRFWFIYGLADCSAQTLMQRAGSARNERVAQYGFYLGGITYLVFGLLAVALGLIGSVTMPGLENPEAVVPLLAQEHLHPIFIAIFVGALLAAIMSSADSALLAAASIWSINLLPWFKRDPSEHDQLVHMRWAIPGLGLLAIVMALKMQVVFDLIVDANSMMLACVAAPFILGMYWRSANRLGASAAMVAGFMVWIGAEATTSLSGDLLGLIAAFLTLFAVSMLTRHRDPPHGLRDAGGNPVEARNRLGVLSWREPRAGEEART